MVETKRHFSSSKIIGRVFWGLMVLGHLPAMVVAGLSADDGQFNLARFIVLTISQAFFFLKLIDVPWLRMPSRRASFVFCIAIALLHAHVAHRLIFSQAGADEPWQAIVMVGGGTALIVKIRDDEHRQFVDDNPRLCRVNDRSAWMVVVARMTTAILPPRFSLLVRACSINRAPPA